MAAELASFFLVSNKTSAIHKGIITQKMNLNAMAPKLPVWGDLLGAAR